MGTSYFLSEETWFWEWGCVGAFKYSNSQANNARSYKISQLEVL